ncbi:RNA-directed DNA polymerase, eukaryota [Tanacetum coccineum]
MLVLRLGLVNYVAQPDFVPRERIVWIDIEGVPLHAWSRPTFSKIGSRWGEVIELEDNKEDCFARKRICIKTKLEDNILEKFKIIVRGKNFVIRAKELFVWSPTFNDNKEVDDYSEDDSVNGAEEINGDHYFWMIRLYSCWGYEHTTEICEANSGLDSSIPFPPGFTPEREFQHVDAQEGQGMENSLSKRRSKGLSSRVLEDAQPLNEHASPSIEYSKKEKPSWIGISDMDVKVLWGNYKFEYTISEAVGYSGGILCVWDPSVFHKEHHVVLDNFVALYGSWVSNQAKLLVCLYMPPQSHHYQAFAYGATFRPLSAWGMVYCRWFMGRFFNEVRCMEDRLGSVYNAQGANEFNSFISNSGLVKSMGRVLFTCVDHVGEFRSPKDEVLNAVWGCRENNLPGPNGVHLGSFFESSGHCWYLIFVLLWNGFSIFSSLSRGGNGLRTQFWNEVWIGDTQLRVMFPRIYALEINKDCTVVDKLQFSVTFSLSVLLEEGFEFASPI